MKGVYTPTGKQTASKNTHQALKCFPFQGWLEGASLVLPGLFPSLEPPAGLPAQMSLVGSVNESDFKMLNTLQGRQKEPY